MTSLALAKGPEFDLVFAQVAREIAINHEDIETILKRYKVDDETWDKIQRNPRFQQILQSEITAWQSSINTGERVKLKAAAMIEDWLPEAHQRMHAPNESLNHKVELAKLITQIAGMGRGSGGDGTSAGERFTVTINLGADHKLEFEKRVTSKVIDAEVVQPEAAE
jgi:hypothetical protein